MINKFRNIEKENKLYLVILTIMMTAYCILVITISRYGDRSNPFLDSKKVSRRFTKLIIDLPMPVIPVVKPKKEVIKDPLPPEEKKLEKVREKPVKQEVTKVIVSKKTVKKIVEEDVENIGMLKLIGAVDESVEGTDMINSAMVRAFDDSIDNMENNSAIFGSEEQQFMDDTAFSDLIGIEQKELLAKTEGEGVVNETTITLPAESLPDHSTRSKRKILKGRERDSNTIETTVSAYSKGVKFCYDNSLKKEEGLSGRIVVRFKILGTGKTESITIISDELHDPPLNNCMRELVARWKFPSSSIEEVMVTYPLYFTSKT